MQTSKGLFVWCGNREQRVTYNLCLDCQGNDSTTCFEQIERGKQMALGTNVTKSAMVNTVSEILFLSEIKKLNELGLNRHKDIKDLLTIMDERLQRIETMLKTPNVLTGTAKKKDETPITTNNVGKVTMTDKEICDLANSVQKENKMNVFLEAFKSKHKGMFSNEEDCIKAVYELWKSASEGHANKFWAARSNKAMQAILCKAFVTSGKANNTETKEKDAGYFIKSFKEVTEEKLQALAQLIEDNVTKKELVKLSGNVLFDSQSRTFILEYFGGTRLDKTYPPEEIKSFLSFLTQFVTLTGDEKEEE